MVNWTEIRAAARAVVHDTFKRPARLFPTADTSGEGVPVSVRVHGLRVETGDLDREGYSQVVEAVETMVLMRVDVTAHSVGRGTYVRMDDTGMVYRLDVREKSRDDFTVTFQLVRMTNDAN